MVGIIQLVGFILVIGVLMWAINTYVGQYIAAPFLKLANVVAILACVLIVLFWVLAYFGVPFEELGRFPRR